VPIGNINNLFDLARAGSTSAEQQLFSLLRDRFVYLARHRIWDPVIAEEVVQSAMLVVCREYKALNVTVSFVAWAQKVLDNRIKDQIRARRREDRWISPASGFESDWAASEDAVSLKIQLLHCLEKIGKANRRYARVLNLRHMGYETKETCERMAVSEGSLYTLLHRSRAMLLKCLKTGKVT
jgi:RNA polymerase sigma factor (sigma-70 family)